MSALSFLQGEIDVDLGFLAQADAATIQLEKAKRTLETAKAELDSAKKVHDEMLAQADAMGIPKAKLKKLTEDRIQALFESGLLEFVESQTTREAKPKRIKTKTAAKPSDAEMGEEIAAETATEDVRLMNQLNANRKDGEASSE